MAEKRGGFSPAESGYVEVKDRIAAFYEKYPDGSIQSEIVELSETLVVVKAMAYRSPTDALPGIGHSQMPIPGLTSFTRNSEIENAETSAWGRAIAALGFEVKRSVASADEVAMKIADSASTFVPIGDDEDSSAATPAQKRKLMAWGKKLFGNEDGVRKYVKDVTGKFKSSDLTKDDIDTLFKGMEAIESTEVVALS